MSPLAIVLWMAVAASLCVYGYRIVRRITNGPRAVRDARNAGAPGDPTPDHPAATTPGTASFLIQNPVVDQSALVEDPGETAPVVPPPAAPLPPPMAPLPPPTTPADPLVQDLAAAPPPGGEPRSFDHAPERRGPRVPVAEAVAGIALPCDLAPLVGPDARIDPFDVAFVTTTFDADHVQAAMVGELVRLGFSVSPTAAYRLVASRPSAELTVVVHRDPLTATSAGRPLFTTVPEGSVVVQLVS